jgi:hypothetical protein
MYCPPDHYMCVHCVQSVAGLRIASRPSVVVESSRKVGSDTFCKRICRYKEHGPLEAMIQATESDVFTRPAGKRRLKLSAQFPEGVGGHLPQKIPENVGGHFPHFILWSMDEASYWAKRSSSSPVSAD